MVGAQMRDSFFPGFKKTTAQRILNAPHYAQFLNQEGLGIDSLLEKRVLNAFPFLDQKTLPLSSNLDISSKDLTRHLKLIIKGTGLKIHSPIITALSLCNLKEGSNSKKKYPLGLLSVEIDQINIYNSPQIVTQLEESHTLLLSTPQGLSWILEQDLIPQVQGIFTSSSFLSSELRNEVFEKWSRRLFHVYSPKETGAVAWQCPLRDRRYHVFSDVFVETHDDKLVITKLYESEFPIVRLKTQDKTEHLNHGECPCGFKGQNLYGLSY